MKKVLFFAYTPFQVIASLAIYEQYYKSCDADIILSDSIQNRDEVKKNILKYKLFNNVYNGNIRKFFPKSNNKFKHEGNRIKSAFKPYFIAEDIKLINCSYDVFITTEVNYYTESIYALLRKANPNVEVELMDEGYSSYTFYFKEAYKPTKMKNRIKHFAFVFPGLLYGRKFISRQAQNIYYFAPELLCWKDIPYKIKPITVSENKSFLEKMNLLFDYEKLEENGINQEFDRDYLYFEESFFWSMRNSNDIDIIRHIADIVGKENMAIKLHPRNEINRFEKDGYKTNETYGLPWEVVASNLPKSDKRVFISFSSGAVLNYKFLTNKNFKTILLYKCIGEDYYHVDDSVKEWFDKFASEYGDSIFIPNTIDELDSYLNRLKKEV